MFKKIVLSAFAVLALFAAVDIAKADGLPYYIAATGTTVLRSTPTTVERLKIITTNGYGTFSIYNATSATGAVAANLVYSAFEPLTVSTQSLTYTALVLPNQEIILNMQLNQGLVVVDSATANTITATVIAKPLI